MNLSLYLELSDKPDTEIQHQESLTIEISHSIVQRTSGRNNYCPLFILLLIVYIIAIIIVYSNTKWKKIYNIYFSYIFFIFLSRGVFHLPQLS